MAPWALCIQQDTFCCKSYCLGEGAVVCLMTTIVIALAMLLACIPCTRLLGMMPILQDLREKIQCSSRSLRGNTFFSHGFFEENVVWTWKSLVLEKEMRGRDGRTGRAKICIHKTVNK